MISSYFTSENVAEELHAQDQEKKFGKVIAVMMSDDLMTTEAFNDSWCSCCSIDCSSSASALYQEHTLRLNLNSLGHT
jgi:hypothetical protein